MPYANSLISSLPKDTGREKTQRQKYESELDKRDGQLATERRYREWDFEVRPLPLPLPLPIWNGLQEAEAWTEMTRRFMQQEKEMNGLLNDDDSPVVMKSPPRQYAAEQATVLGPQGFNVLRSVCHRTASDFPASVATAKENRPDDGMWTATRDGGYRQKHVQQEVSQIKTTNKQG
ncbi:hypothetical protein NX059_003142 [Plenodomus lindquistii]|nr:hypothetical protein NX059_003142 [Plenodomus lindquistii]